MNPQHSPFSRIKLQKVHNEENNKPSWEFLYNQEKERNLKLLERINEKEKIINDLQCFNQQYLENFKKMCADYETRIQDLEFDLHQKIQLLQKRDTKIKELEFKINEKLDFSQEKDLSDFQFQNNNRKVKYLTLGYEKQKYNHYYNKDNTVINNSENIKNDPDLKSQQKFIDCMTKAVIDCSPAGLYKNNSPTIKQIWKWVRNVLQEYMELKKRACGVEF